MEIDFSRIGKNRYRQNPIYLIKCKKGDVEFEYLITDAVCFSNVPSYMRGYKVQSIKYFCLDTLSTILGSTKEADEYLKAFKESHIYGAYKEHLTLEINEDVPKDYICRTINLTLNNIEEWNYTEILTFMNLIRGFQEGPWQILDAIKVLKKLKPGNFLLGCWLSYYTESKDKGYNWFIKNTKVQFSPGNRRLDGHGITSPWSYRPIVECSEEEFVKSIREQGGEYRYNGGCHLALYRAFKWGRNVDIDIPEVSGITTRSLSTLIGEASEKFIRTRKAV